MDTNEHRATHIEPLQCDAPTIPEMPRFVVGPGRRGGWIVNDRLGLVGGIFVSEAAARHFAFEESGGRQDQMVVVSDTDGLEFEFRRVA